MPRHHEIRKLPWTARQMYDLVADVESYPKFLPWNSAARIRSRKMLDEFQEQMDADLVISFKVFRERFGSRVILNPSALSIGMDYLDGPFKYMRSSWVFRDLASDGMPEGASGGCEVEFHVDFEFKNAILQGVIGLVFQEAMSRIVRAFEARAEQLYRPKA